MSAPTYEAAVPGSLAGKRGAGSATSDGSPPRRRKRTGRARTWGATAGAGVRIRQQDGSEDTGNTCRGSTGPGGDQTESIRSAAPILRQRSEEGLEQFGLARRGYNPQQVDEHIADLKELARQHRQQAQSARRDLAAAQHQLQEQQRPSYSGLGSRVERLSPRSCGHQRRSQAHDGRTERRGAASGRQHPCHRRTQGGRTARRRGTRSRPSQKRREARARSDTRRGGTPSR